MNLSPRKVRIISYATALLFVISAFAVTTSLKADYYRRVAIASARQAAANLSTSAEQMKLMLQKCAIAPTDELAVMLSSQLYGTSLVTAAAIDALPWQQELEKITATIEDVELFALKCAETGNVDRSRIKELLNEVTEASDQLSEAYNSYHGAFLTFGYSPIDPYNHTEDPDISKRLSKMHGSNPESSADTAEKTASVISEDKAKEIASNIFNANGDVLECTLVSNVSRPVYHLNDRSISVGIDAETGRIIYYSRADSAGGENFSIEDALKTANNFIKEICGSDAEIKSYRRDDGYLRCDAIMCENNISAVDMPAKIIVDLGDGQISCFSAIDYSVYSAGSSAYTSSSVSDIQISVPENAQNINKSTCIISTPWNENIACREYVFTDDKQKYIVYYDCETGAAVDIRIVTEDDSGIKIE